MSIFEEISKELQQGRGEEVVKLVNQALEENYKVEDILNNGLIQGMNIIGAKFKKGEIFIPEVLIAARAMNKGIERIEPLLLDGKVKMKGKFLVGTVKDDLHDIGKNLASIMFRGSGFDVKDLGVNVSEESFVNVAKEYKPDVIGLSALLTTTMVNMEGTIKALRESGCEAIIVVGGAPVTERFAESINADIYAPTAVEGVERVIQRMN
jgi:5-methyltetrahydrofolate--homocysteine methyltransferase